MLAAGILTCTSTIQADEHLQYEFYFARSVYSDEFSFGDDPGGSWSIDFPKADRLFLRALDRLSSINSSPGERAVKLTDPDLTQWPFIYALEVGAMQLSDAEIEALQEYLLAGGFLFVDDFWGSWAWNSFAEQMRRVFPDREIVEIPITHPIFSMVYEVEEIVQVPNLRNGVEYESRGITHEEDGKVPHVRGIFDDEGRLMVLINWNTDLGDAWEWADNPEYPSHFSMYAVKLGVNAVVYAMTH